MIERCVQPRAAIFPKQSRIETDAPGGQAALDGALAARPSPGISDPEASQIENTQACAQNDCEEVCKVEQSSRHCRPLYFSPGQLVGAR